MGERHGAAVSGGAPLQEGGWMTSGPASSDQRLGWVSTHRQAFLPPDPSLNFLIYLFTF